MKQYETQWTRVTSQNSGADSPEEIRDILQRVHEATGRPNGTNSELIHQLIAYLSNKPEPDPEVLVDEAMAALLATQSKIWNQCLCLLLLKR